MDESDKLDDVKFWLMITAAALVCTIFILVCGAWLVQSRLNDLSDRVTSLEHETGHGNP